MTQKIGNDKEVTKRKLLVFDTNIFLTGIDFNLIEGIIYTSPKVIEEITVNKYKEKNRNIINKIQAAVVGKKLILKAVIVSEIFLLSDLNKRDPIEDKIQSVYCYNTRSILLSCVLRIG